MAVLGVPTICGDVDPSYSYTPIVHPFSMLWWEANRYKHFNPYNPYNPYPFFNTSAYVVTQRGGDGAVPTNMTVHYGPLFKGRATSNLSSALPHEETGACSRKSKLLFGGSWENPYVNENPFRWRLASSSSDTTSQKKVHTANANAKAAIFDIVLRMLTTKESMLTTKDYARRKEFIASYCFIWSKMGTDVEGSHRPPSPPFLSPRKNFFSSSNRTSVLIW